jgi:hypothetical protein
MLIQFMSQDFTFQDFYTHKIDDLTLGEALKMHYQLNPQFTPWQNYPQGIEQETMKSHDICHVIFGCDTGLLGEFRVELWSAFGTNLGAIGYQKIASNKKVLKEPLEIVRKIGYFKVFRLMLTHFIEVFRIPYLSRKMKKKWPCFEEEPYMLQTVGQIRKEFGIQILKNKSS